MKYTKTLLILVSLIFIAGLLVIAADSYADEKNPRYIDTESSSLNPSISAKAINEARAERYKRYLDLQAEAEGDGFDNIQYETAELESMDAFSDGFEAEADTAIDVLLDDIGSDADTGAAHDFRPLEDTTDKDGDGDEMPFNPDGPGRK